MDLIFLFQWCTLKLLLQEVLFKFSIYTHLSFQKNISTTRRAGVRMSKPLRNTIWVKPVLTRQLGDLSSEINSLRTNRAVRPGLMRAAHTFLQIPPGKSVCRSHVLHIEGLLKIGGFLRELLYNVLKDPSALLLSVLECCCIVCGPLLGSIMLENSLKLSVLRLLVSSIVLEPIFGARSLGGE